MIGLNLSLTYGWVIDPRPAPIGPASLTSAGQEFYIRLVAAAFYYDRDEAKAKSRLSQLEEPQLNKVMTQLTERYIAEDRDVRDIRAMVTLVDAVGEISGDMVAFLSTPTPAPTATPTLAPTPTPRPTHTPTPATPIPTATRTPTRTPTPSPTNSPTITRTPTVTRTPTATTTPRPTRTSTPGPDSPFGVAQSKPVCNSAEGGLLKIYIRDRLGAGLPGVQIAVSWPGGKDTLFSGFKPEIDPGYADFELEPDETYRIELRSVEMTGPAHEVTIDDELCPNFPAAVNPSWEVVFQQGIN